MGKCRAVNCVILFLLKIQFCTSEGFPNLRLDNSAFFFLLHAAYLITYTLGEPVNAWHTSLSLPPRLLDMYVSYFSLISFPIGLHTYSKTCINNMQIDANLPTPLVRPSALICVSPISWTPFGLTIVEQPILLVLLFWHQRLRLLRPLGKVGFTWGHIRIPFRKGGGTFFFLWLFKLWKHQLLWLTLRNSYYVSFAFRHLSATYLAILQSF